MTWQMFAGRDERNGGYRNFGHEQYVKAYGHAEPIPVILTETKDGPYYGWIRFSTETMPSAETPGMIQQFESLFSMQFTYGVDAEVKAGRGRVVRLAVTEDLTAG